MNAREKLFILRWRHWLALVASLAMALGMVVIALMLVQTQARAEPQTGSISGTVTYSGGIGDSYELIVAAHLDVNNPPVGSVSVSSPGGDFTIAGLPDGDYYLSLFLDVSGGGGPPEFWEPNMWYDPDGDMEPNAVTVAGGVVSGIHLDLGGPWLSLDGPRVPNGQVNDIAANLTHPETVFAAAVPAGTFDSATTELYKTIDGGQNWSSVLNLDKPVFALAAAGDMVYAGLFNQWGENDAIYRSTDGGDSWEPVFRFPRRGVWIDLSVNPLNPDNAVAGGWLQDEAEKMQAIVYGTTDGGVTWSPWLTGTLPGENGTVNAVLIHPVTPTIVLAAVQTYSNDNSIIYRSDDGGATWGDSFTVLNGKVTSLAVNPDEPQIILAGVGTDSWAYTPDSYHRVLRSLDAGLTWNQVFLQGGKHVGFIPPDKAVAVDFNKVWVSQANGDPGTWQQVGILQEDYSFEVDAGATPAALYVGGWRNGVWKSEDGGATWFDDNNGISTLVVASDIVVDPSNGQVLYLGTMGSGGWRSDDGGQSWSNPEGLAAWMDTFAVNPHDSNIVFGGAYDCGRGAVLRSQDGGLSFTPVYTAPYILPDCSVGDQQIYSLAIAPSAPETVFASGWFRDDAGQEYAAVLRSQDHGDSWEEVFTLDDSYVRVVAINPQDEGNVFIGGIDCTINPCAGFIYRSLDGGDSWDLSLAVTSTVTSIVIDPQKPNVVYMADEGYWVRKSVDGGDTWEAIITPTIEPSGYLLAIDPLAPSHIYLGGWGYIAESTNGGETWSSWVWDINRGSPTREPAALTVFNDGVHERLFASYFGVWAFDRSAPQPGDAATIDMWTDPLEGPIYANGLNGVMYYGLVRDEKLNWVADSTPVTVTYDMSQLTGEILRVVKRTKNGIVRGGVLGVTQAGVVTFTAETASGAIGEVSMEFIVNPPAGITVTAAAPSILAGGQSTVISATVPGLYEGIATNGTEVQFETSLGVIDSSGFTVGGVATATLTSSSGWGTAIVTASVGEFSDQVQVQVIPIKVMLPLIIR